MSFGNSYGSIICLKSIILAKLNPSEENISWLIRISDYVK